MTLVDRNSVVVNTGPRITADQFAKILEAVSSPALVEAALCYKVIVAEGIDPAYCLASFAVESAYGTVGICHDYGTYNPGNCRSSSIGIRESITDPQKGTFVKYPNWYFGFKDMAHRLIDKAFPYAQAGAKTIRAILPLWAPGADSNSPDSYVNTVVNLMNRWIGKGERMEDPTNIVKLIPGHAGRGRGGLKPKLIVLHVQEGLNDLYQEFSNRPAGNQADCTMWSKQDGTLVRLLNDSDCPWTNGDVVDPDMSNPIIAGMVLAGVDNTNAYSYTVEHQGFASKGFSDAQVEATAKMCAYWCSINGWESSRDRIVGHYQVGAHKGCPGPLFPFDKVVARAKELLGSKPPVTPALPYGVTVDPAGALIFPGNIPLNFGFKDAFLTLFGNVDQGDLSSAIMRAVKIFGLPVAPEVADPDGSSQDFELATFRFNKNEAEGWKVRLYRDRKAA